MIQILAPEQVTAEDVIRNRQEEILTEKFKLDSEMLELKARMQAIDVRMAHLQMEHQILEDVGDRRTIYTPDSLTSTIRSGRKNPSDRLTFEDALKKIFDIAGRPMSITEIMGRLEQFGFIWSKYQTAYAYITKSDVIEPAGRRGFYQIRQIKW